MEIETVRAGLDDLPLLLEWRIRVLREVFSLPEDGDVTALTEANRRYYERHLGDGTHTACFARDRETGEILGCGGICYQEEMPSPDSPGGTCGYLMNIYTVPSCRGKGIGRRTVEFLLRDARSRGTGKICLESTEAGRPLYERLGFADMEGFMKLSQGERA